MKLLVIGHWFIAFALFGHDPEIWNSASLWLNNAISAHEVIGRLIVLAGSLITTLTMVGWWQRRRALPKIILTLR